MFNISTPCQRDKAKDIKTVHCMTGEIKKKKIYSVFNHLYLQLLALQIRPCDIYHVLLRFLWFCKKFWASDKWIAWCKLNWFKCSIPITNTKNSVLEGHHLEEGTLEVGPKGANWDWALIWGCGPEGDGTYSREITRWHHCPIIVCCNAQLMIEFD